ncbi:hypothetical protein CBG57_07575 [Prevotella nigrescens]|nr:hypothetical protein CBG57_07575 [Prevotella nigrescens]
MCISQTKNADHLLMIKKNKYGQYFTIEAIAEFMVSLINQGMEAKVLEPSCGKGVFFENAL